VYNAFLFVSPLVKIMQTFTDIQLDHIADALTEQGYLILDDALPSALLDRLIAHINHLHADSFKPAGIGRQSAFQVQQDIRSDSIHWIESNAAATSEFLAWMDTLRLGLNRRLFMGLCDYESHFAHYPIGAFYKKHLDAFTGKTNRVLSTVLYLNQSWSDDQGGELLIYTENGEQVIERVAPIYGRLIIFLSEKFPHEVLPATRERKSIAGWFRINEGKCS